MKKTELSIWYFDDDRKVYLDVSSKGKVVYFDGESEAYELYNAVYHFDMFTCEYRIEIETY